MNILISSEQKNYSEALKTYRNPDNVNYIQTHRLRTVKWKDINNTDLLITFDLVGFENVTLTDNLSYNLYDCKQIHILTHDNLSNESMLNKPLSLAMFFYVVGDDYCNYLQNKYPGLPYLKKIDGWQPGDSESDKITNSQIISNIIDEVASICGL